MQSPTPASNLISTRTSLSPPDSSIDDLDDIEICIDELADDIPNGTKKPHFLDYDNIPPFGYDDATQLREVPKDLDVAAKSSATTSSPIKIQKPENDLKTEFKSLEPKYPELPKSSTLKVEKESSTKSHSKDDNYPLNRYLETEVGPYLNIYRGTWPKERYTDGRQNVRHNSLPSNDLSELCPKMECVYSLLSMLGSSNSLEMSAKFLDLSKTRETCTALRKSGCIPLLIQIIHSDPDFNARKNACMALHNVILCHPDDKAGRREARVLKLIEQLIDYCDSLKSTSEIGDDVDEGSYENERHPIQAIGTLMKISFDEEHRHAMCQLGALQTISSLVQLDHSVHGANSENPKCITVRRYAGMILTNLTFGDGNNKALLCSNKCFMKALVVQIGSSSDELVQVTASVLRNLSWRADATMKQVLNEIGTVKVLTKAAMTCNIENTLKAILSALWNLSNHCPPNKSEFCEVEGAIEFLVDMLEYDAASKTMSVIENAGGILRNISSHISMKDDYRKILRHKNCLGILLQQLKSPSLTVVSNACGTLGNLSADNCEDQKYLRENGAIPMLRSLIYSKHKMISTGSSIALRNLLNYKTNICRGSIQDSVVKSMDLKELPTLNVRKKKALEQEFDKSLSRKSDAIKSPSEDHDNPVDYSLKFNETKKVKNEMQESSDTFVVDYQETDIDQITDYSLRYAENQSDSDEEKVDSSYDERQENVLIPEDSIKCYYTEGTPHAISSATSMSDLRINKDVKVAEVEKTKVKPIKKLGDNASAASGFHTPDKPFNYCDEGTPREFSRHDSLSSLESAINPKEVDEKKSETCLPVCQPQQASTPTGSNMKSVTFVNFAEETPLMFSRTSSMGSLSSADPICTDDKSSIISDFSRLASGIISPSELPDSPTQSIPNSPRRALLAASSQPKFTPRTNMTTALRSAFDDEINTFNVENTPAQFSCATSLSNLSMNSEENSDKQSLATEIKSVEAKIEPQSKSKTVCDDIKVENVSDAEESENDDLLLESCINMGMNCATFTNKPVKKVNASEDIINDDSLQRYCTENTPARLSKAASNSNLSILSLETNKNDGRESDESSNISDNCNDKLLEECIRDGMPKPKSSKKIDIFPPSAVIKENPMGMLRNSSQLPPYFPDETNTFHVENSPCAFSAISALSDITVGSDVAGLAKMIRTPSNVVKESNPIPCNYNQKVDDSLSSLSMESDDDNNLLNQAIAAGIDSKPKNRNSRMFMKPLPLHQPPRPVYVDSNDSISSIDSCDSNDNQSNSLLEQCIRTGMKKTAPPSLPPRRSFLPVFDSKPDKRVQNERDDELLSECIKNGMPKSRKAVYQPDLTFKFASLSLSSESDVISKNGETTSANTTEIAGATNVSPGVEVGNCQVGTDMESRNGHHSPIPAARTKQPNGCRLTVSGNEYTENLLERSNEYPAIFNCSTITFSEDSITESSDTMQMSNEFIANIDEQFPNKHKDPDLMLKSVERLTQDFVSTAEYLRTVSSKEDSTKKSYNTSNNTWNDDTCPNDVSFPSVSVMAPKVASLDEDDVTISDIDMKDDITISDGDSGRFDERTPTNEYKSFSENIPNIPSDEINFHVGGEVKHGIVGSGGGGGGGGGYYMKSGAFSYDTLSANTMTNPTVIAIEAKKVANKLQNIAIAESAVGFDLNAIIPPFGSGSINLSEYFDATCSSNYSKESRKNSLQSGILMRRALGTNYFKSTSVESINSLNNLENIAPPSIMDELMDSMISVASITSEIADLPACHFDSTESEASTPKTTPKQKRQLMKDRYKTYTIPQMMIPTIDTSESSIEPIAADAQNGDYNEEHSSHTITRKSIRQKRQENKSRYETQVIETANIELPITNMDASLDHSADANTYVISIEEVHANIPTIESALSLPSFETPRAHIATCDSTKPKTATTIEQSKAIRGMKKMAYVSPYRKTSLDKPATTKVKSFNGTNKVPVTSSSLQMRKEISKSNTRINTIPTKPTPQIVRSKINVKKIEAKEVASTSEPTAFANRSQLVKLTPPKPKLNGAPQSTEIASPTKLTPLSNRSQLMKFKDRTPPKSKSNGASQQTQSTEVLIRQGTFIKDEPTNTDVPVVTSEPSTPSKKMVYKRNETPKQQAATTNLPARTNTFARSRLSLQKSTSMEAAKTPDNVGRFGLISSRTSLLDYKKAPMTNGYKSPAASTSLEQRNGDGGNGTMIPVRRSISVATATKISHITSRIQELKNKIEINQNAAQRQPSKILRK